MSMLYSMTRGDIFTIDGDKEAHQYMFGHVDGMYSYCRDLEDESIVHLKAWTPITVVGKGEFTIKELKGKAK